MTAIVAGGKQSMPFFIRVLNAFGMRYAVLHDTDMPNDPMQVKTNETILRLAGPARVVTFPIKLEDSVGVPYGHLKDQYDAHRYFAIETNISEELSKVVAAAVGAAGA